MDAIYFRDVDKFLAYLTEKYGEQAVGLAMAGQDGGIYVSFIYYPEINSYQERESLQIVVKNYC